MSAHYVSTAKWTVCVECDLFDYIIAAPPLVAKFKGQPIENLRAWASRQPGFWWENLSA